MSLFCITVVLLIFVGITFRGFCEYVAIDRTSMNIQFRGSSEQRIPQKISIQRYEY